MMYAFGETSHNLQIFLDFAPKFVEHAIKINTRTLFAIYANPSIDCKQNCQQINSYQHKLSRVYSGVYSNTLQTHENLN